MMGSVAMLLVSALLGMDASVLMAVARACVAGRRGVGASMAPCSGWVVGGQGTTRCTDMWHGGATGTRPLAVGSSMAGCQRLQRAVGDKIG